jgi:glutamate transport system ATP-binding protein
MQPSEEEEIKALDPRCDSRPTSADMRLEPIDRGTIEIDGKLLPEGRSLAALRAEAGMAFQSFSLFAYKTILEKVTLAPLKVRKIDKGTAPRRTGCPARARRDRQPARNVSGPTVGRAATAGRDRAALAMNLKIHVVRGPRWGGRAVRSGPRR